MKNLFSKITFTSLVFIAGIQPIPAKANEWQREQDDEDLRTTILANVAIAGTFLLLGLQVAAYQVFLADNAEWQWQTNEHKAWLIPRVCGFISPTIALGAFIKTIEKID